MIRTPLRIAVSVAALGFVVASAPPALAGNDDITRNGNCSGSTNWKLKAKSDDGRLEVEGEIDSNHNGQTWHWKIKHDGKVARHGTAQTRGASGSFSVERRIANSAGKDRIGWTAKNPKTGETCRGSLKF